VILAEAAFDFACEVLKPGGTFVAKVWQGGTERELLERIKKHFATVKHAKPKASRQDSAENFVVAMGFRNS
jgi:23S rRNA (uridine2552-2'-O)-methyltransferase